MLLRGADKWDWGQGSLGVRASSHSTGQGVIPSAERTEELRIEVKDS